MANVSIYTEGGAVQAGSGVYLERAADLRLLELCRDQQFAFVLTSRQMGKTSLMEQTASRLGEQGVASVVVDLSCIGVNVTPDAWYLGILTIVEDGLEPETDVFSWWSEHAHLSEAQRFALFFEEVILKEITTPIVVFVDEVDTTLNLPFTDDFFAAVRSFYNKRAQSKDLRRLTFVLMGTASPGELIADSVRTPFNIGQEVLLTDFSLAEARPLADGLGLSAADSDQVLQRILYWTGGHPSLTQKLCIMMTRQEAGLRSADTVDQVVNNHFLGSRTWSDNNLQFVRGMLTRGEENDRRAVLNTYRRILRSPIKHDPRSSPQIRLKLAGIVTKDGPILRVRNRIYALAFNRKWLAQNTPIHWPTRLYRTGMALTGAFVILTMIVLMLYARNLRESKRKESLLRLEAVTQAELATREAERAQGSEARALANEEKARELNREISKVLERQRELAEEARREKDKTQEALEQERWAHNLASLEGAAVKFLADGLLEEAAGKLKEVHRLYQQRGNREREVETLDRISRIYARADDMEAAIATEQQALTLYRGLDLQEAVSQSLYSLAGMQHQLGNYREAARLFEEGLPYLAQADPEAEVRFLSGMAQAWFELSNFPRARETYLRARELARKAEPAPELAQIETALGRIDVSQDAYEPARNHFLAAQKTYAAVNDRAGVARAAELLGLVAYRKGNYQEAIKYFERALEYAIRLNQRLDEKSILGYLFQVRHELGQKGPARDTAAQFLAIPSADATPGRPAQRVAHDGRVLLLLEQWPQAYHLFTTARNTAEQTGDRTLEARCRKGLAECEIQSGNLLPARKQLEAALALEQELDLAGEAIITRLMLARTLTLGGERDAERQQLERAFEAVRAVDRPYLKMQVAMALGDFHAREEQSGPAFQAYGHAIGVLEDLLKVSPPEIHASLAARFARVYLGTIRVHLDEGRYGVAFHVAERMRTFTGLGVHDPQVVQLLARWENYTHAPKPDLLLNALERVNLRAPRAERLAITVSRLQDSLDAQTTLIAYLSMADHVLAFVISADEFHTRELPFSEDYLFEVVSVPSAYFPLYKRLMAPIKDLVKTRRVGVVPHGMLLAMPSPALDDWSRWLSEDRTAEVRVFPIPSVISPVLGLEEIEGEHLPPSLRP